jgi:hypothetical protein
MYTSAFQNKVIGDLQNTYAIYSPYLSYISSEKIVHHSPDLDKQSLSNFCLSPSACIPYAAKTKRDLFCSAITDILKCPTQFGNIATTISSMVRRDSHCNALVFCGFSQGDLALELLEKNLGRIQNYYLSSVNERLTTTGDEIAIVGMAARLPGADDPDEFWDLSVRGKDVHEEV